MTQTAAGQLIFLLLVIGADTCAAVDLELQREQAEQQVELKARQQLNDAEQGELTADEEARLDAQAEQQRIQQQLRHERQQKEKTLLDLTRDTPPGSAPPAPGTPQNHGLRLDQQQQQLQFRIQQQLNPPKP